MHKVRVLVAVRPPALLRVIEHLLSNCPEIEVVASRSKGRRLAQATAAVLPELVVANGRLLGKEACQTIAEIKRSSPGSKLILISSVEGFAGAARRCGADACLDEEALVRRLLLTVRKLISQTAPCRRISIVSR